MHTTITLTKPAEDHTWEEEHEVWVQIKQFYENHISTHRRVRDFTNQEMTRLGFK